MLASLLDRFKTGETVVLALARGGVPVAYEVARRLHAPLDVMVVRKLGVPGHDELAMGAIASGGVRVLNDDIVAQLSISAAEIERVARRELEELARREEAYRGTHPAVDIRDRAVVLVDDGLATGATMRAAVEALRRRGARSLVVAVPIGAADTCRAMGEVADEVVCAWQPEELVTVGTGYETFEQTDDDEVRALLTAAYGALQSEPRPAPDQATLIAALAQTVRPLVGAVDDFDPLLELIGDARIVLLGGATQGTHEFYRTRAVITQRLIRERAFSAIAVEGDWPDASRVDAFVRGAGPDRDAAAALGDFQRFPEWMWRNTDVLELVTWLRRHNDQMLVARRTGFYGLDLRELEELSRTDAHSPVGSWNLRDTHMADTLDALLEYLATHGAPSKIVVWAHNAHVGDVRATELGPAGELDLGQLCRQRHPGETVLVGFTTYSGTVTAASDWGAPEECKRVPPALAGSYEELFHLTGHPRFFLQLRELGEAAGALREPRLHRAIGAVYRSENERHGHYYLAKLPAQFDAVIHIDETRALEPLRHFDHVAATTRPAS